MSIARAVSVTVRESVESGDIEIEPQFYENFIRQLNILASIDYIDVYTRTLPTSLASACSECVICQEDIQQGDTIIVLPCNPTHPHRFHEACIQPWIVRHSTCPTCRGTF